MSALSVEVPFPVFYDRTGEPLENGYVWIGQANLNPQTNPIQVYFDRDLTQPAAQPLRTQAGYIVNAGTPAQIYVDAVNFSILVQDKNGTMVYNFPDGTGIDATVDAQDVVYNPPFTNAVPTNVEDRLAQTVSVKDFGAVGVYGGDDTQAIIEADQYCFNTGKTLFFPAGQYCVTASIEKYARWVGVGAPELAPFPQNDDDKIYLRPGFKNKLPGSSIILTNNLSLSTVSTVRSDQFSSFNYVIKTVSRYPGSISGIAIVMDMDVYDVNGNLTLPATDNRVSADVAFLVDDSSAGNYNNLVVFGYWVKGGVVILTRGVGDNPDYNKFAFGTTMGDFGLALIGNDTAAGDGPGLSGTQCISFQLFGNDHHSRRPQTIGTHPYGHCLFIDGKTAALETDINGHEFVAGGLRTLSNRPMIFDNASNMHFVNVPIEFSQTNFDLPNTSNATTQFIGTANTRNFTMMNSRNLTFINWDNPDFGGVIENLTITQQQYGDILVGQKGEYLRIAGSGAGDNPRLQFTNTPTSSVNGWMFQKTTDGSNKLSCRFNNSPEFELYPTGGVGAFGYSFGGSKTIASGEISVVGGRYTYYGVDTEGGAASDDLETILGGVFNGQILILRSANNARDVVLKDGPGNLRLAGDFTLTNTQDRITLQYDGANWIELSRSDNSA